MTIINKEYCFVMDSRGKQLAPTSSNKGWYLIRKNKAELVERFPMVIRLNKVVDGPICDITLGIDDGSKEVGVALVQKCDTKNKVIFKGVIYLRQDVSKLMGQRAAYRRLRRSEKRYRPKRFHNRKASNRKGRIPPSIYQKKQTIIRFVNKTGKWVNISKIILENVLIDIRALTDGYKPYKWQYQQSNRLDENLRKACLMRDNWKCRKCGKNKCELHAHHINPRRNNGSDSIHNLITLCVSCHDSIKEKELSYINKFQKLIKGRDVRLDYAQHVMQGKTWLQQQLSSIAPLELTDGGATANRRIDWDLEKSHSNDAVAITGLKPNAVLQKDWDIKPKRKKRKMNCSDDICGFRHGDFVSYIDTKKIKWVGYITAMYHDNMQINIQCPTKHLKRVNAKKCMGFYKHTHFNMI